MKNVLLFCFGCLVILSAGCTTSRHYDWGHYENQLFNHFHKPEKSPEVLESMLRHVTALEKRNRVVPPGVYAELGTLYLEQGDKASAKTYYEKEKALWPESQTLMTALISSLSNTSDGGK